MQRISTHTLWLIVTLFLVVATDTFAFSRMYTIRHWVAPDHTRVVVDLSGDVHYEVEKSEKIVSITFKDVQVPDTIPRELVLKKPGIERIILDTPSSGTVRMQLILADQYVTKVFKLQKFQEKPDRVVIDVFFPEVEKKEAREREQVKVAGGDKVVVIDPGHGGEDPGAIGKRGTQEKMVVLAISKKVRDILNKKKGYRAYLTRDGDYYVPFKKRLKIAREYGADLFISIHADASQKRSAQGSSVYCLSLAGASSEAAKILARNENLADIIGGDANGESNEESDPILLNMFQTNTINTSKIFGRKVLRYLQRVNYVKFNTVQEAPFRVLKLPEIPSLLVETAYLSNPREERLLQNSQFQMKIARALAASITDFFSGEPQQPSIILTESREKGEGEGKGVKSIQSERRSDETSWKSIDRPDVKRISPVKIYTVKRGDTLEKIARAHGTDITSLLKLNRIKLSDPLYIGRPLKIPIQTTDVSGKQENVKEGVQRSKRFTSPRKEVVLYTVKKGDTLEKIAKQNGVTPEALIRLNTLKKRNILYVGQTLKIPTTGVKEKEGEVQVGSNTRTKTYVVRKGDTLDKIAQRFGSSVSELCRLNHMKRNDVLYVNRRLKLPAQSSM